MTTDLNVPADAPDRPLTIAEAAERTGLTAHTLRYYERDGLMLDAVARSSSGHRRYNQADLTWITLITRLRATGMPIREVRGYAALCRRGEGNERDRLQMLYAHQARVQAELATGRQHLAAIEAKVDLYEERVAAAENRPRSA